MTVNPGVGPDLYLRGEASGRSRLPLGSSALLGALQEPPCGGCSALLENKTKMDTELTFPGAGSYKPLSVLLSKLGETGRQLPSLLSTQHDSYLSLQLKGWSWKCGLLFP